jgi:FhuF 2Fe-2S C-terminal domain
MDVETAVERIAALRAGGFGLTVELRDGPGEGWVAAGELPARLDDLVDGACELAGIDHPPLGAEWVLEHCAWQAASLTVAALMDGWVPDLAPERVLLQARGGSLWGIALAPAGGVAAGSPVAAHDALAGFLGPVVDAVHARRLRAPKALWRAAGDRVAQAFLWCGSAYADPARARALAEAMLAPPSPMHVPLRTGCGEDGSPMHLRSSCCLYHRVPGVEVCAGCPLRQSRRLRAAA